MLDGELPGGGQRLQQRVVVLVRVLRVNRLPLVEGELDSESVDPDALGDAADEVHLDAAVRLVVEGAVIERCEIEVAAELAVDPSEEVAIEGGGDAEGVIVGRF